MRIAIFQDTWHPKVDGVVVSTELFKKGLEARGHEVKLIVPRYRGDDTPASADVHFVEAVKTDFIYPGSRLGKLWNTGLAALFETWKPDLIHSMTEFTIGHWLSSYWRDRLGVPRVHTFHTLWTEYLFYAPVPQFISQPWLRFTASRAVRKRADAVIAPTEGFAEILRDDWGITSTPIDVLPTGIEIDRFKTCDGASFRARHGIGEDEKVVLYLGRLGDEKNVELVIDSMAELRRRGEPDLRFVVAGGGPDGYVNKLKQRAAERGLDDILWTGFIKGQEWLDCYGAADVLLFPSVTETQGLVVVEALAAGVPLVSVEAMGPASTMKGERGCLFAEPNATDFADKTVRLLRDEVLHERKKREALAVAQEYSLRNRAAQLEGIYARLLGQPVTAEVEAPRQVAAVG